MKIANHLNGKAPSLIFNRRRSLLPLNVNASMFLQLTALRPGKSNHHV
jgi:hypothetical protein